MQAELIHADDHAWSLGPRWTVSRCLPGIPDPMVVQFHCKSPTGPEMILHARWEGGWDQTQWVPRVGMVPATLLRLVEGYLEGVGQ